MLNNTMKFSSITVLLFILCGCDSLGEIIREKKYTVQLHETPNSKQSFGYNNDHDYVGFMVNGNFGARIYKHTHNANCSHEIAAAGN